MRGRCTEFVADKLIDPSFAERNWISRSLHALLYVRDLSSRRIEANSFHVRVRPNALVIRKAFDEIPHGILQTRSTRNDNAKRDRAVGVQALEVLKVAIKEGVFVVPFDFKSNSAAFKISYVIDFVRLRFALDSIDDALNHKIVFSPAAILESVAKALRAFGLAAA